MKVVSVGLKGFIRDNGLWSWTPEVQLEMDPLTPELLVSQKRDIATALDQARTEIKTAVEEWNAEERTALEAKRAASAAKASEQSLKVPPVNASVVKEQVYNDRKAGDEYDATNKKWLRCVCGNEDINKTTKDGKPYQACFKCQIFLQTDGKVKGMGAKQ